MIKSKNKGCGKTIISTFKKVSWGDFKCGEHGLLCYGCTEKKLGRLSHKR